MKWIINKNTYKNLIRTFANKLQWQIHSSNDICRENLNEVRLMVLRCALILSKYYKMFGIPRTDYWLQLSTDYTNMKYYFRFNNRICIYPLKADCNAYLIRSFVKFPNRIHPSACASYISLPVYFHIFIFMKRNIVRWPVGHYILWQPFLIFHWWYF